MRWINRFLIIFYSLLMALVAMLLLLQLLNANWGTAYISFIYSISGNPMKRSLAVIILLVLIVAAVSTLVFGILGSRMTRARIRRNEVGSIDIGVGAIENIALNSAKAAQAGVKSARARIRQAKGGALSIQMLVQLYSDVEIPSQMAKIQDRVRKDVERYTGIAIADVNVKVRQVELVGAKIER